MSLLMVETYRCISRQGVALGSTARLESNGMVFNLQYYGLQMV